MPTYNNVEYVRIMRPLPDFTQRDVYGIPFVEVDAINITHLGDGLWLTSLNNASSQDTMASRKIVHSFKSDDVLRRCCNNPYKWLDRTAGYLAVSSFDISMDPGMECAQVLWATFLNRWSGAFAQAHGRKIVPTVGWTVPDHYDICFAGLRDGGVFLISTLGAHNDDSHGVFMDGYQELRRRFPKTRIICVGNRIEGMDDDVCYVKYRDSFGYRKKHFVWQPPLLNWDMTMAQVD